MVSGCFNVFMSRIECVDSVVRIEPCYTKNMNGQQQNFSSFLKQLLDRENKQRIKQSAFILDLNADYPHYTHAHQRIDFK